MKKASFKRWLSLMMTFVLVLAASVTVFAADYSITIKEVPAGAAYTAYQLFAGTVEDDGSMSNITWGNGFADEAASTAFVTALEDEPTFGGAFTEGMNAQEVAYILEGKDDDSAFMQKFAEIAATYMTANGTTGTRDAGTGDYKIDLTAQGYYFVKDTTPGTVSDYAYSRYILKVAGEEDVDPKNDIPSLEKKITKVNGATNEVSATGATSAIGIGDTVTFQLDGKVSNTIKDFDTYKYIFTDVLDDGFTLDLNSVVVTYEITGTGTATGASGTLWTDGAIGSGYTGVAVAGSGTTATPFTVTFADLKATLATDLAKFTKITDFKIVVTYNAKVNSNAVVGTDGNKNEAKITYSNNPYDGSETTDSTPKTTTSYTYEIDIYKNDGNGTAVIPVSDAGFVIGRAGATGGREIAVFKGGKIDRWIAVPTSTTGITTVAALETQLGLATGETIVTTSSAEGQISIAGLAPDVEYKFTEVVTPDGYLTVDPFTVTLTAEKSTTAPNEGEYTGKLTTATVVSSDNKASLSGTNVTFGDGVDKDGAALVNVIDPPASKLPSTGGSGVYFYYIVGGLLVLLAAAALIFSKKKSGKEV